MFTIFTFTFNNDQGFIFKRLPKIVKKIKYGNKFSNTNCIIYQKEISILSRGYWLLYFYGFENPN